ncbi:MAG: hypothetical protein IPL28_23880 [Chloroflexi bacterium]|nr:hypothetical protein [Chloroflexota bacterium]
MLEKKRLAEKRKRRGTTKRTIVQSIWLGVSAAAAYFFLSWLTTSETLSYDDIYRMGIPREIPEWGVLVGGIIIIVLVMQMVFVFGYILGSPQGRVRSGTASAYSTSEDIANLHEDDDDY